MIEYLEGKLTDRSNIFVIALTGQTGSGCTATANIMSKLHISNEIPNPEINLGGLDDRKYSIIYKYYTSKVVNNIEFKIVNYVSFINERIRKEGFEKFKSYLEELRNKIHTWDNKELITKVKNAFNIESIEEFSIQMKNILSEHSIRFSSNTSKNDDNRNEANLYTYLYQNIGKNLRQTDYPYEGKNKSMDKNNMFLEFICDKLKNEKIDKTKNKYKVIILDSIKNPFEAIYFKRKIENFYLFSIRINETQRRKNLKSSGYKYQQILDINIKEFPTEDLTMNNYGRQDLDKCIDLADIHLVNNGDSEGSECNIKYKKEILKYLSLIINPGIITPSEEEKCMQIAYSAKANSGCLSRKVGAVLTDKNYNIKSIGWNSSPNNLVPCLLRDLDNIMDDSSKDNAFSDFECKDINYSNYLKAIYSFNIKKDYEISLPYCFKQFYNKLKSDKNQVHTRAIHAEEMAFLQKENNIEKDSILFTTSSPCELCAKKATHLGISKVYYITPYPGISIEHILSNNENIDLEIFSGAVGSTYHKIYSPLFPLKDSINCQKKIYRKENFEAIKDIQIMTYVNKYKLKLRGLKENEGEKEAPKYGILTESDNTGTNFNIEFKDEKFCFSVDINKDVELTGIFNTLQKKRNIDITEECPNCGYKDQDTDQNPNECNVCGFNKEKVGDYSKVYLTISPNLKNKALCNRLHRYTWEKFEVEFINDGYSNIIKSENEIEIRQVVHIKSLTNDKYLSYLNDCVIADKDKVTINDTNSKFILVKKITVDKEQ